MPLDKFESFLQRSALFFCRADKFSDPFEGSIPLLQQEYRENLNERLGPGLTPEQIAIQTGNNLGQASLHEGFKMQNVINSWHINNNESDAMWQLYLKSNEGVAISTTVGDLYGAFDQTYERIGSSKVRYLNYETEGWYHPIDYPHSGLNMLIPLIHKRIEFQHECEFRLNTRLATKKEKNAGGTNSPPR